MITALLAVALSHVLSLVLDLSRTIRSKDDLRRDAQLAAALVRRDLSQAKRVLSASSGALDLLTAAGDTVHYGFSPTETGTFVRWVNRGLPRTVAAGVDTAAFALQTVSRPYSDEELSPLTTETTVVKFEPGDWDEWVNLTSCEYDTRAERHIDDNRWCAEEFWPTESFDTLTRAALRVKAIDHNPPEVDLLIRIYRAGGLWGQPGLLLAEGRISRLSVTPDYTWIEVPLTTVDTTPISAGGHYWVVFRPGAVGSQSYAGHMEVERLRDCTPADAADNHMFYRQSDFYGISWDTQYHRRETFFRLYGGRTASQLVAVNRTVSDTLGVDFELSLSRNSEREYRAEFVALRNL